MATFVRSYLHRVQVLCQRQLIWQQPSSAWKISRTIAVPARQRSLQRPLSRLALRVMSTQAFDSSKPTDNRTDKPRGSSTKLLTLPTMLTVGRVVAVPVLVAVFFSNQSWSPLASTAVFVGASITDWLDGYLARKMKLNSPFGAFLDPVADKLMVSAALVLLCTKPLGPAWLVDFPWLVSLPAIIIISREIVISAVREWAAVQGQDFHKVVAVDSLGKLKTASQMVGVTFLLAFGDARDGLEAYLCAAGLGVLHVSTGLAVWSLCGYLQRLSSKLKQQQQLGP